LLVFVPVLAVVFYCLVFYKTTFITIITRCGYDDGKGLVGFDFAFFYAAEDEQKAAAG